MKSHITTLVEGTKVSGHGIDQFTRCTHYHSPLDVVAIKFNCCNEWFACYLCHLELCDHLPTVWPASEFNELAALCGRCGKKLTIEEYIGSDDRCPNCDVSFNPGCRLHHHLYFAATQ